MKTIILLFVALICFPSLAGKIGIRARVYDGPIYEMPVSEPPPIDPIRVINGQKVTVGKDGWVKFQGTVLQVLEDGIRIRSDAAISYGNSGAVFSGEFFVANFPYQVAESDVLVGNYFAKDAGIYTYMTVMNVKRSVHKLDYCTVWKPQPAVKLSPAQIDQKKAANAEKVLKFHQALAEKGDAYGQCKMGMHYVNGDGVEKDIAKGCILLKKSADQGNQEAAEQLKKLESSTVPISLKK